METDHEDLARLEMELLNPRTRGSRVRLQEILAPGFIELGASGVIYGREDVLAALAQESAAERWLEDLDVEIVTTGVPLVRYRAYRRLPGEHDAAESLRCSLWRQEGGAWKLLYHQGTPVPAASAGAAARGSMACRRPASRPPARTARPPGSNPSRS